MSQVLDSLFVGEDLSASTRLENILLDIQDPGKLVENHYLDLERKCSLGIVDEFGCIRAKTAKKIAIETYDISITNILKKLSNCRVIGMEKREIPVPAILKMCHVDIIIEIIKETCTFIMIVAGAIGAVQYVYLNTIAKKDQTPKYYTYSTSIDLSNAFTNTYISKSTIKFYMNHTEATAKYDSNGNVKSPQLYIEKNGNTLSSRDLEIEYVFGDLNSKHSLFHYSSGGKKSHYTVFQTREHGTERIDLKLQFHAILVKTLFSNKTQYSTYLHSHMRSHATFIMLFRKFDPFSPLSNQCTAQFGRLDYNSIPQDAKVTDILQKQDFKIIEDVEQLLILDRRYCTCNCASDFDIEDQLELGLEYDHSLFLTAECHCLNAKELTDLFIDRNARLLDIPMFNRRYKRELLVQNIDFSKVDEDVKESTKKAFMSTWKTMLNLRAFTLLQPIPKLQVQPIHLKLQELENATITSIINFKLALVQLSENVKVRERLENPDVTYDNHFSVTFNNLNDAFCKKKDYLHFVWRKLCLTCTMLKCHIFLTDNW